MYDYIIIGSGPTGLTLATLFSKYGKKCAIIEKESYIGGCHSVRRVDGLFSEHGPRIYIDNYFAFKKILTEIGTSFNDLFTKYNFGTTSSFSEIYDNLTIKELSIIFLHFINLNDSYKHISMNEFMVNYNFSDNAKSFLDRIGKLTDGGDSSKYTLYNFLQIINQNFFYSIYQPKFPNDIKLFKIWYDKLVDSGVDIFLNSDITNIDQSNNLITKIYINDNIKLNGNNFILSMPPESINKFIKKVNIPHAFGNNFDEWSQETNYITYIPIIFHWNTKLKIKKIWGLPRTSWGIGHIVLSDYMNFNDPRSQTVISTLITLYGKSDYLQKNPNEITDKNILINETLRQLKTVLGDLPDPTYSIMADNYYNHKLNQWVSINTAFMTTKYGYIDYKSPVYDNLYNCGVQNGISTYSFTSMESSIQNAIGLTNILIPESKNYYNTENIITVRFIILLIIILFCISATILITLFNY